ncbi:hypothetical protein HD553DRAFT_324291 [Filobasidium floriforme]|uniref:uncharacterized protein n=1 Tax=Filobasidium floriforme TaxID=5210 RepID=UPI001E8E17C2|nr:uncharacterized protein HD553DRAFT_324291 [Filobasidium floriforme]KAH8084169.1 hypothetical protein HD553DRAFT_324291 [Filobasidium floriforme]
MLPMTPAQAPPPLQSLARMTPSLPTNNSSSAERSSLAKNPAFANNPFVIGNCMSTKERKEYLMATDPRHESNIGFYRFPNDLLTPKLPIHSGTPVASPAWIEVQQQQLTWVDVAALIVIASARATQLFCTDPPWDHYKLMRKIFKALFKSFWQGISIVHISNPRRPAPTGERIIKSTHHFILDLLEFVQDDALDTQASLLVPWLGLASDFECVFTLSLRACRSLTISIASYVFHLRR